MVSKVTTLPTVDVIIPVHNRKDSVLRALASLERQTFPTDRFGVIVIDDGSTDDTPIIAQQRFPFVYRYVRQKNQGATVARNNGARLSHADILVFIDDDVTVSTQTLEALVECCCNTEKIVVIGTLLRRSNGKEAVYTKIMKDQSGHVQTGAGKVDLHFVHCNTELMACKRSDFFEMGMLQDPTEGHGWPNWDDVDFGFRAHHSGFRLVQSKDAVGEHWDYSLGDGMTACKRWYRAARSAVWLFRKHPELRRHIPMLLDKTPITWGQDSPALVVRKLARSIVASPPMAVATEKCIKLLERHYPSPSLLRRLYFWMQGTYMFKGYRDGLRDFARVGPQA